MSAPHLGRSLPEHHLEEGGRSRRKPPQESVVWQNTQQIPCEEDGLSASPPEMGASQQWEGGRATSRRGATEPHAPSLRACTRVGQRGRLQ